MAVAGFSLTLVNSWRSLGFLVDPGFSTGVFQATLSARVHQLFVSGEHLLHSLFHRESAHVAPYMKLWLRFSSTHLQLPYTLQWNASVEQALGNSQTLTISYVGSHAARLLQENVTSTPTNPNPTGFSDLLL